MLKIYFTNIIIFAFSYDFCYSFVNNFILLFLSLIISIAYSLKNLQKFFMQSLLLHASSLFSTVLNDNIVDIERVHLLFLWMNYQYYFYIPQSFLLNIQDLNK